MEPDKKFFFDRNIFDAPEVPEEMEEDLPPPPPPPPTFSEEELSAARDIAFEQGRQKGQKEQIESREQSIAMTLDAIAENFSLLFAAEQVRENIFEKESLRLSMAALDALFPLLDDNIGRVEVMEAIKKTLTAHRKNKEISIYIPAGMKDDIEKLVSRIRAAEHEDVLWQVMEDATLSAGSCKMEWADGGAVRDSARTATEIRRNIASFLGDTQETVSEMADSDISLEEQGESVKPEGDE